MTIRINHSSLDGIDQTREFTTLAGARRFAVRCVGETPEIADGYYAVSGDGISKVMVSGATLGELFPATVEEIKRQVDVSIREIEPISWSNPNYLGDNVRVLPFDEQSITLTISFWIGDQMISEDSRDESLKMMATMNEWGALRDVEGFSFDDLEINRAIDAAIKEAVTQ